MQGRFHIILDFVNKFRPCHWVRMIIFGRSMKRILWRILLFQHENTDPIHFRPLWGRFRLLRHLKMRLKTASLHTPIYSAGPAESEKQPARVFLQKQSIVRICLPKPKPVISANRARRSTEVVHTTFMNSMPLRTIRLTISGI